MKKWKQLRVKEINNRIDFSPDAYGWLANHQGEIFEPVKVSFCVTPCKKWCPGHVQAPWMDNAECWGFDDFLYLEPIWEEPRRMLRPLND